MRPLKAYLSKSALHHNIAFLKQQSPLSDFCAVLKANAYGHRTELIAPIIEDNVNYFAVAMLEEAQSIRAISKDIPIILLEGVFEHYEYNLCDEYNFIPTISNQFQLNGILDAHLTHPIDVYIKINSGMNRLGIHVDELTHYYQCLAESNNVRAIKIITHLSSADEHDTIETDKQLAIMANIDPTLQSSISNSAHIFHTDKPEQALIRAGIAMYGASPFAGKTAEDIGLKPIVELRSAIIHINHLKAGDHVGYGATFTAEKAMVIGVVACGYADGYPREISNDAYMLIDGYKAPIVGRIAMDMLTVDLSDVPESKWDRDVIVFGQQLPVEYVAKWAKTIPYTIFTHLAKRIHFHIID